MEYVSRFEDLYEEGMPYLSIRTSLDEILKDLEYVQEKLSRGTCSRRSPLGSHVCWQSEGGQDFSSPSIQDILVLHPPRIIRALVNEKIITGVSSFLPLVEAATKLALNIYSSDEYGQNLASFRSALELEIPDLLHKTILQVEDRLTSYASSPSFSSQTAQCLSEEFPEGDILFLPLCNGGTMAGLDVFLRYQDLLRDKTVPYLYCGIRYSRLRCEDTGITFCAGEEKLLSELARDRTVVIFDEDVQSGTTLWRAEHFLRESLGKNLLICSMANYTCPQR